MKGNLKKFLILLSMLACVFSITACDNVSSSKISSGVVLPYDEETVKSSITTDLKSLSEDYSNEQLTTMMESADESVAAFFANWMNEKDNLGKFVEIISCEFDATSTMLTVNADCKYSLRNAVFTISYNAEGTIISSSFTPKYSMSEKIEKAGLNTVIGISLVFLVLLLISIIISLFKYISIFENHITKNSEKNNYKAIDNTIAQIIQKEQVEQVEEIDDAELIAVIMAAIAASEGNDVDGLVVRSIKKTNKSKWQSA